MKTLILPPIPGILKRRTLIWTSLKVGRIIGRMIYIHGNDRREYLVQHWHTGSLFDWYTLTTLGAVTTSAVVSIDGWAHCDCDRFHMTRQCIHDDLVFLFRLRGLMPRRV